jgi:hypothetical protein
MTTTYVRLKNRRGNRENLPQPLAEGEIGLATDTRELFIGAGSQDSKNRMVQVDSFLNAEVQTQSLIDTRLVMFTLAGTQSFLGDGINASSTVLNSNVALTLPTGKSTPVDPDDITVTKFDLNNSPTAIPSSNYTVSVAGSDFIVTFVSTAIPEANSKIVVTPWTVNEIVSSVSSSGLGVETNQDLSNNALYIDLTTGTGFVDIGSGTQSTSATTLSGLTEIASANDNANLNIRGTISDLGYASSKLTVPGTLLVETDSPTQAILLSKFLNTALGTSQTSVASNIKIFTQDSKPVLETDQYIGQNGLIKSTLSANTSSTVFTYDVTSENTIIVDYSLKINNAYAVGTIKIISDGANVEYMDDRIETNDTSAVAFSTPSISGTDIKLSYTNTDTTYDASMSYVLKRWLTS